MFHRQPTCDWKARIPQNCVSAGCSAPPLKPAKGACPLRQIKITSPAEIANQISDRLAFMRQEMSDLRVIKARYWVKSQHTALDKTAHALRQGRLLGIKQGLSDMMKRCA
jgi:hypothetical protein